LAQAKKSSPGRKVAWAVPAALTSSLAAGGVCPDAAAPVVTSAVPHIARTMTVLTGVQLMFMVPLLKKFQKNLSKTLKFSKTLP
jgi:hypothetical protein